MENKIKIYDKARFIKKLEKTVESLYKCDQLAKKEFNKIIKSGDKIKANWYFENIVKRSEAFLNKMSKFLQYVKSC
jgi:SPX domain protein involved in polyphosphate accumulation